MTKRVPKLVQRWVDSIKKTDPVLQSKFYSKGAILFKIKGNSTFSNTVYTGKRL